MCSATLRTKQDRRLPCQSEPASPCGPKSCTLATLTAVNPSAASASGCMLHTASFLSAAQLASKLLLLLWNLGPCSLQGLQGGQVLWNLVCMVQPVQAGWC